MANSNCVCTLFPCAAATVLPKFEIRIENGHDKNFDPSDIVEVDFSQENSSCLIYSLLFLCT